MDRQDTAGQRLNELIEQMRDVDGIDLVGVLDRDGLMLASSAAEGVDPESVAATAASGLLVAEALGQELARGAARQTTLEYAQGLVLLTPLDDEVALLILANPTANLGRLRLIARRSRDEIIAAVRSFTALPGADDRESMAGV